MKGSSRCFERQAGNPHVICGLRAGRHMVNLQEPLRSIREMVEVDNGRIYDLRHSIASLAVANDVSLPIATALLGHTQLLTTHRYAHLSAEPLKQANAAIDDSVTAAMRNDSQR